MIIIFENDTSYWKVSDTSEIPSSGFAHIVGRNITITDVPLLVSGHELYISLSGVSGYLPGVYTLIPHAILEDTRVKVLGNLDLVIVERR